MSNINVVYSGWIFKCPTEKKLSSPFKLFSRNKWKNRYFVLSKTTKSLPVKHELKYYTKKSCKRLCGSINLAQCEEIVESFSSDEYPYVFSMKTTKDGKEKVYVLGTETEHEMLTWVWHLSNVCEMKPNEPDQGRHPAHLEAPNIGEKVNPPNTRSPTGLVSHQFRPQSKSPGKDPAVLPEPVYPYAQLEPVYSEASESSEYTHLQECRSGLETIAAPAIRRIHEVAPPLPPKRSTTSWHIDNIYKSPPKTRLQEEEKITMVQASSTDSLSSVPDEYAPPPPIDLPLCRIPKVPPKRKDEALCTMTQACSTDSLSSVPDEYAPPPPIQLPTRTKLKVSPKIKDEERSKFKSSERPHDDTSGRSISPKSTAMMGKQDSHLTVTSTFAISSALQKHEGAVAKEQAWHSETRPFKTRRVCSADDEVEFTAETKNVYAKGSEDKDDQPPQPHHGGSPLGSAMPPGKCQQYIKKPPRSFRRANVVDSLSLPKKSPAKPMSPKRLSLPQLPTSVSLQMQSSTRVVSPQKSPDVAPPFPLNLPKIIESPKKSSNVVSISLKLPKIIVSPPKSSSVELYVPLKLPNIIVSPQKSPNVAPPVPLKLSDFGSPQKAPNVEASLKKRDRKLDYVNIDNELVWRKLPPIPTKADELNYIVLDRDLNTDTKPISPAAASSLSTVEYQCVDFRRTEALREVKEEVELERSKAKSAERSKEKSPECSREKSPECSKEKSPESRKEKSPESRKEKSPECTKEKHSVTYSKASPRK